MKSPRRLLLLEDNPNDAELLGVNLSAEWPDCEIMSVDNERDFLAALKAQAFDLILSDYALHGFHGAVALQLVREQYPTIPFVFVSGAIGDEVAVECLKAGATDYVLKDRLCRLVPAVRRALNEAEASAQRKQVEEELHQSEEQYRDLFENASDLIQSVTPEGRFLYVNRAWRENLGYAESEIASLTFFDVLFPKYHEEWRSRFKHAKPDETYGPWETTFVTKYGRHLYVEGNLSARFESGKLVATREIFHDVTERKLASINLKRSIAKYEALVNAVDGVVWQAELPSMRFTFVSRQAELLLGYPLHSWLGEAGFWQAHIHPDDREQVHSACKQLTVEQGHQSLEYRMVAADGRVIWLRDLVNVRFETGRAPQIQGIMVDVTERKRAEEAMHRIQAELEKTNKDLVRRNQEIQNFYHTLSHELKTPLTSAREFISIVMEGIAGRLKKTQFEYLDIARSSCDQLRVCINDLLDTTRLETGKMALTLKPASLADLVERVVAAIKPSAREKKISLQLEIHHGLPDVPMDENRIVQVVVNLLNNAIKYSPIGGKVMIQVCEAPGKPEFVQVSVSDVGCGIAKEEQDRVFDRLYQIKAGDAATERGIGLGLYLCRELVQLHSGNICVESEPGQGSTFFFTLPAGLQTTSSNLLVIEDDPNTIQLLCELLKPEQFNVRIARDGLEGLEAIRQEMPDMILLDLALPNLDGAATLKEIRKEWGAIPVIVHTGCSNNDLMKRALEYSPFTLLAKPCTPDQIIETVRKIRSSADTTFWKKNRPGLQNLPENEEVKAKCEDRRRFKTTTSDEKENTGYRGRRKNHSRAGNPAGGQRL